MKILFGLVLICLLAALALATNHLDISAKLADILLVYLISGLLYFYFYEKG